MLFAAGLQVYFAMNDETIDVVRVLGDSDQALLNTTKPLKLSRRLVLRNVVEQMVIIHAELRENAKKMEAERQNDVSEVLKRLVDVKEAGKASVEKLSTEVSALKTKVEQEQQMLETQALSLTRLETQVEYAKASHPRHDNYTQYRLTEDSPDNWQQRTFRRYGSYGFIKFSAYRVSKAKIAVLGLASLGNHDSRRLLWCEWHSSDGSVTKGVLEMLYMEEHHSFLYEVVVLNCNLEKETRTAGGDLKAMIDSEEMYLFREDPRESLDMFNDQFKYNLMFCGPPMYGQMNAHLVREWLDYHRAYMGADHFIFYDAGALRGDTIHAIEAYLKAGMVSITNFRESAHWDVWLYAQGLAIQDCLYRARPLAKWVFMHDFDEFLVVTPPTTVPQLLRKYEDKAWITHGCIVFGIHECSSKPGEEEGKKMLVEKILYTWPHIYCQNKELDANFCLDHFGHRKYILNPRKVDLIQIHKVILPAEDGVDLSVEDVHHAHYQSLAKRDVKVCDKVDPTTWWKLNYEVANIASAARECPLSLQHSESCSAEAVGERVADMASVDKKDEKAAEAEEKAS